MRSGSRALRGYESEIWKKVVSLTHNASKPSHSAELDYR
jgi:hypothetical protein